MLGALREHSKGLLAMVLFGIIAAVFIINFGPQSSGCAPVSSSAYAARVKSATISDSDFRYAFILSGGAHIPPAEAKRAGLKEAVMEYLIQRSLAAQAAREMGFVVSDDEVNKMLLEGKGYFPGMRQTPFGRVSISPSKQSLKQRVFRDGAFDYERFRRFVQYELGVTPKRFVEQQRQELLAQRMRDAIRVGISVSEAEARADFDRKETKVNLLYVSVAPRILEKQIQLDGKDRAEFIKKNEDAIKKRYERKKFLYEKLPPQARVRHLLAKLPKNATAEQTEKAKAKAEAWRARLQKGEDMAKLAAAQSEDEDTRAKGGDLGWRTYDGHGQGVPFGEALKKLVDKPNEISEVVKSDRGFHVLRVEAKRSGKAELKDVQDELAEEIYREQEAQSRATQLADEALERLKKGEEPKAIAEALLAKVATPGAAEGEASVSQSSDEDDSKSQQVVKAGETGLFARSPFSLVEGIGYAPDLMDSAFRLTPESPYVDKPVNVGGKLYVVKLKERKNADPAEFAKRKAEIMNELEQRKWDEVVRQWMLTEREKHQRRIRVNPAVLVYDVVEEKKGPDGKPVPAPRRSTRPTPR